MVQGHQPLSLPPGGEELSPRFHRGTGSISNERPRPLELIGWERILEASSEAWNAKAMTFMLWERTGQPAGLN